MSEAIEAQLKNTAAAHADAIARTRVLHEQAVKARQEATEAATLGEVMLADAAAGEADDLDDDALLSAREKAERAQAKADIASAKHAAGLRKQHLAQIERLRAEAAALQGDFDESITKLLGYAEHVDECLADLQDALAAFHTQQAAVRLAHQAARHHNSHSISPGHTGNPILRDLQPDKQPRVIVPQHLGHSNVQAELYEKWGTGTISAKRVQVHALAPRMRHAFNRPVDA
jgi:hypothetical protein